MSSRVLVSGGGDTVTPMRWRNAKADGRLEAGEPHSRRAPASSQTPDLDPETRSAVEAAFQRGRDEGAAAARAECEQSINRIAENAARTVASLAEFRPRLRKESEADLVKLSVAIARRILKREISVDPDSIRALIKVALEKLQAKEGCRARIHPDLYRPVKDWLERLAPTPPVEVTADSSLEPGGIIFESAHGDLDASIESQLREIERGFADRLGS